MAKGDKIPGGLTDKWSVEDVAKKHNVDVSKIEKELETGTKIELEHTNSKEKAREIALDHLYEIPDYYTRLKDMENKAEKEMNEGKENITSYARRMRELAGLSEGTERKSLKTINEGDSSFEDGVTFYAKDMAGIVNEEEVSEAEEIVKESNKEVSEEVVQESEEGFETHKFEQKTIEEGEDDQELYTLNENTIIVLDFLNEEVEEASEPEVRHGKDRKGPTDSATWHDEGKEMKGEDGNMWKVVTGSNNVNRWVRV